MNEKTSILGIIPARGGSKGVHRKNIHLLNGRPLIAYTIETAFASRRLTKVIVSTEDKEIAEIAGSMQCDVVDRPVELAMDNTPTLPVVLHAIEQCQVNGAKYDFIILLQPTTPLRTADDIDTSLDILINSNAVAVISVVKVPGHYHPDWQFVVHGGTLELFNGKPINKLIPRRQMLSNTYTRNGAIYGVRTEFLLEHHALFDSYPLAYEMPEQRSVNIDSEIDLALAEYLLNMRNKRGGINL